jgi:hypothetical protein
VSETNLPPYTANDPDPGDYKIVRKGSLYNITGPHGREFSKFKSASAAGPRWEELTHTPWPYESTAYTPGMRLWELGIIRREHVGLRQLLSGPALDAGSGPQSTQSSPAPSGAPNGETDSPQRTPASPSPQSTDPSREPTSAVEPPRESMSKPDTSQTAPQPSPPAKESATGEREDSTSQPKTRPAPSPQPTKPRQRRLMFQENWEGYREPIKPDARPKKSDREPADDSEDD